MIQSLLAMMNNKEIIQNTTNKLMKNKSDDLKAKGGVFLFGYRIVDDENNLFEDPSILSSNFQTIEQSWNSEKEAYDSKTTTYFQEDCSTVAA